MTQSRFEDLGISEDVLKAVRSLGWTEPTPVQAAAIPVGLEGKDLLAQAQTGTGKTGAYGSIILNRTESGSSDPTSLVLVPTRELASQVSEELSKLSEYSGHVCIPIYGGVNIENQAKQLKKGADIVVATPGRLKDLIERKMVDLSSVCIVVLDEADRMLDMGFVPSVNMILSRVPKKRQSMMFSATMPDDVKKLAVKHMINHEEVLVSKDELTLDLTEQYFMMTSRESKRDELEHLFEEDYSKIMVFCRTKHKVDYLSRKLKRADYKAEGLHGDVSQNKRARVLKEFSDGALRILITSDVASRGLDIDGVDLVVNYDIPVDVETYVHRIGRTGRAGNTGVAITFVNEEDIKQLHAIEKTVSKKLIELPPTVDPEELKARAESAPKVEPKSRKERKEKSTEAELKKRSVRKQNSKDDAEKPVRSERTLGGKLDKGVVKTVPESKKQAEPRQKKTKEPVKNRQEQSEAKKPAKRKEEQPAKEEPVQQAATQGRYIPLGVPKNPRPLHSYVGIVHAARPKKDTSFDRLEINVGAVDDLDIDKLKKFIIKTAGIGDRDIGNIHISDTKSRVQVVRYRSQEVVDELFGQVINGKRVLVTNLSDKR